MRRLVVFIFALAALVCVGHAPSQGVAHAQVGFGAPLLTATRLTPPVNDGNNLEWWDARRPGALSGSNAMSAFPDQIKNIVATNSGTCTWSAGTGGVLGGVPTFTCAASAYMTIAGTITLTTGSFTLYAVTHSAASLPSLGYIWDSNGTAIRSGIFVYLTNHAYFVPVGSLDASSVVLTAATDYIFASVMVSGAEKLYINSSAATVATGTDAFSGSMKGGYIGDYLGGGANGWDGPIEAIYIRAGADSTGTISSVFSYYASLTGNTWN